MSNLVNKALDQRDVIAKTRETYSLFGKVNRASNIGVTLRALIEREEATLRRLTQGMVPEEMDEYHRKAGI